MNEQMVLEIDNGKFKYTLKLIAGILARRIRMWVEEGASLNAGDKIAVIMFGSRAELIFPKNVNVLVKEKDKIRGGLTLLAKG